MTGFKKMPYDGEVRTLLSREHNSQSIVSEPLSSIVVSLEGFPGDNHSGLTRAACSRYPEVYDKGVEVRNSRQLTLVSSGELAEIASGMEIDTLEPGWLGANIELHGIPSLSLLPPATRLVFAENATLVVDLENGPCVHPAKVIDKHYPGKGRGFIKNAIHKRGITAWVERTGKISLGDHVEVFFPDQSAHPDA